jgi:type II secretory ATPase GspE/PulE/Tfp pilus assembly ATPase PilB-like protein
MMPSKDSITTLEERGMLPRFASQYRNVIRQPFGMVLVCGPMGSGKTNTLYSSILDIKNPKLSFRSAENPVEMKLDWVQQTSIPDKGQFTFKDIIKAFVRANPKVILIGELRDQETALEGHTAAMLGHLVFATTHGNDSAKVIQRLVNLGATRDDLAAALSAIISQRLIRKLCLHCRKAAEIPSELRPFVSVFCSRFGKEPVFYEASKCQFCRNSGYSQRLGIFELLEVDDAVSQAILDGKHASIILRADEKYEPMIIDGIWKVFLGLTDVAQLKKAVRWNLPNALTYLQAPPALRAVNE